MTRSLAFILLFALVLITFPAGISRSLLAQERDAQGSPPLTEVDLTVNAIGLDTSYANVRRRLGAPQRARRVRVLDDTCSPPHSDLTLYYPGLKIELQGTLAGRNYEVVSLEVTSPRWAIATFSRCFLALEGECLRPAAAQFRRYAASQVHWTSHQVARHGAEFYVILGQWGDGEKKVEV